MLCNVIYSLYYNIIINIIYNNNVNMTNNSTIMPRRYCPIYLFSAPDPQVDMLEDEIEAGSVSGAIIVELDDPV